MEKISSRVAKLGFFSMLIIFLFSLIGSIIGAVTAMRAIKYGYVTTSLTVEITILIILFFFILWLVIKNR